MHAGIVKYTYGEKVRDADNKVSQESEMVLKKNHPTHGH